MKRETLRRIILTISAIMMPLIIFFVSPVVALMAAADGTIAACTIVLLSLFILAMFLGRFWCGWLCPCGGMQDLIGMIFKKKTQRGTLDTLKVVIFIFWFGAIVLLYIFAGGILSVNLHYQLDNGINGLFPGMFYVSFIIIAILVIITAIYGSRSFCRYICPVGVFLKFGKDTGRKLKIPQIGIAFHSRSCTNCGKCTQSCPMGVWVVKPNTFGTNSPNCINCFVCSDACRTGSLRLEISRDWKEKR